MSSPCANAPRRNPLGSAMALAQEDAMQDGPMFDVIVVGGGPTGFVTALGLVQAGVEVCLVEAEDTINDSPRACVYHWSMLDGLERLGIREEAERIGYTKDDYL